MLSQVALLGINFLGFLMLLKSSSLALFGAWVIFITIVSIVDTLRQGLLHHFFIKSIVEDEAGNRKLISKFLWVNYGVILAASLLVFILKPVFMAFLPFAGLNDLLNFFVLMAIAQGSIQFLNSYYTAFRRFKEQFFMTMVYSLAMIASIAFFWFTNGLEPLTYILCQFSLATGVLIYHLLSNRWYGGLPDSAWLKQLFSYGRFTAGTNLMSLLFHKADVILIGVFLGPVATSLFHFASKIINYCELPMNSISNVLFPKFVSSSREDLPMLYTKAGLVIMLIMAPIVIISYGFTDVIIGLLGKAEYMPSSAIIKILLLATLIKPWGRIFGLTLDAIGKPEINFRMLSFSLFLNLAMNLCLIPIMGITGAALATTLSIIITITIGQFLLNKHLGWNRQSIAQPMRVLLNQYFFNPKNTIL